MGTCLLSSRFQPFTLLTYSGQTSGTLNSNGDLILTVTAATAGMRKILGGCMTYTWTPNMDTGHTHTEFKYTLAADFQSITLTFHVAYANIAATFKYQVIGI